MRVNVNKDVIVYEEADEVILINMTKNRFYSLDKMGTVFWKCIVEISNVQEIVDKISAEFEVSRDTVKVDLDELLVELLKAEVIDRIA